MATLHAAYDDPANPAERTVYPPGSDCRQTCWLTIDVDSTVDVAAMA